MTIKEMFIKLLDSDCEGIDCRVCPIYIDNKDDSRCQHEEIGDIAFDLYKKYRYIDMLRDIYG